MSRAPVRALGVAVAIAMAAASPAAALAATTSTSVALTAGTLDFATAPQADPFAATTLSGHGQTLHTAFHSWGVDDARGSGAGWNVTMQASPLDDGAGHQLPAGSLTLVAPVAAASGLNVALPPVVQGATFTLDGGAPVKVLSALVGTGQGAWDLTQSNLLGGDLVLSIPADVAAGTYTTTITSTLATGP